MLASSSAARPPTPQLALWRAGPPGCDDPASLPTGFRNRDLRPAVVALWGLDLDSYGSSRMSYDLRRLRLKGLISRVGTSHRYTVTT